MRSGFPKSGDSDKSPVKVAEKFWRNFQWLVFLEMRGTLFLISLVVVISIRCGLKHGKNEFHSIALIVELPFLLTGCD